MGPDGVAYVISDTAIALVGEKLRCLDKRLNQGLVTRCRTSKFL